MIYINKTGKQNQVWMPKPYDIIINECPDTDDAYNSGYTSGYTDGLEEGYPSGRTDGFEEGYTSGYTDGLNACSGGSCEEEWQDGYDSGYTDGQASVDCTDFYNSGYTSGKTDGIAEQKAKMTELDVDNGDLDMSPGGVLEKDFYNTDGWNHVWVAVDTIDWWNSGYTSGYTDGLNACSGGGGYSQADLDAAFASGYSAGLSECSGFTPAADLTLNVASAITGTGQASVTVTPSEAGTDITYTSSDHSKATIDDNGVITVVGNGNVTFCAIDAITELQDCKTVAVSLPAPAANVMETVYLRNEEAESGKTMLLTNRGTAIAKAELRDGTEIPLPEHTGDLVYYNFPVSGLNSVKYTLTSNTLDFSFMGCHHLISVVIPSGVTVLSTKLLARCTKLSAVTLPEGLLTIGTECFACESFLPAERTTITIPSTVTTIGGNCFEYNTNLQSIVFLGTTPPSIESNSLRPGGRCVYYVPSAAVNAYKTAWPTLASDVQANPNE